MKRKAGGSDSGVAGEAPRSPAASASDRTSSARDVILREAAHLFSTKGYAESGLREIAEMAGIRSSTVYYHFTSKEQIYEEIIRIAMDVISKAVTAELNALPADASVRMRVEASMRGHLRAIHGNRPFTSTNAQSRIKLPGEVEHIIGAMREQYSNFWRLMMDEAKTSGALKPGMEPKLLRPLMLGTMNRTVGWFNPELGSVDTLVLTMLTMFSGIWSDSAAASGAGLPASASVAQNGNTRPTAPKKRSDRLAR